MKRLLLQAFNVQGTLFMKARRTWLARQPDFLDRDKLIKLFRWSIITSRNANASQS